MSLAFFYLARGTIAMHYYAMTYCRNISIAMHVDISYGADVDENCTPGLQQQQGGSTLSAAVSFP